MSYNLRNRNRSSESYKAALAIANRSINELKRKLSGTERHERILMDFAKAKDRANKKFADYLGIDLPDFTAWKIIDLEKAIERTDKVARARNRSGFSGICYHYDVYAVESWLECASDADLITIKNASRNEMIVMSGANNIFDVLHTQLHHTVWNRSTTFQSAIERIDEICYIKSHYRSKFSLLKESLSVEHIQKWLECAKPKDLKIIKNTKREEWIENCGGSDALFQAIFTEMPKSVWARAK